MITAVGSRSRRSVYLPVRIPLFSCLILFLISGLAADDPASSKGSAAAAAAAAAAKNDSNSSVGLRVLIVCLALVAAVAISVMLYKFWQKKKRAEQHARLLKLFEDDDELEVELGIRD